MRTKMTAAEVRKEAYREKDALADYVSLQRNLWVSDDAGTLYDAGNNLKLGMSPRFHQQMAVRTGIPGTYYSRLQEHDPELLAMNINRNLKRTAGNRALFIRTLDGNAQALLSNRYKPMDSWLLQEAIDEEMSDREDARYLSGNLEDGRFYQKWEFGTLQAEVKPGDIVSCGALFFDDIFGGGAVKALFFMKRLVCSNGMTVEEKGNSGITMKHLGAALSEFSDTGELRVIYKRDPEYEEEFRAAIHEVVRQISAEAFFKMQVERMKKAAEQKIEGDPRRLSDLIVKEFALSKLDADQIYLHLEEDGDFTRWGMANAVTRTAQDVERSFSDPSKGERSYHDASHLEKVGGDIILMTDRRWQVLNRAAA